MWSPDRTILQRAAVMVEVPISRPTPLPDGGEEVLRLACPNCGGGLHLRRCHLGVKGQCVHCRSSLVAVVESGGVRVMSDELPAPFVFPVTAAASASGMPGPPHASLPSAVGFAAPLPTRDGDNLFGGRPEILTPSSGAQASSSPFGDPGDSQPCRSMFGGDDESSSVASAWGISVPQEVHASISPFGTGSADGSGLAESLFREKVAKDAEAASPFVPPFARESSGRGGEAAAPPSPPALPPGNGTVAPIPDERITRHFFGDVRAAARRAKLKHLARGLALLCLLGGLVVGASFLLPQEVLDGWKKKAVEWLEPGRAILEYLPESLRPDWHSPTGESADRVASVAPSEDQRDM